MGIKERLNKIEEALEMKGSRPILIILPNDDTETKNKEFNKIHGKDFNVIIVSYANPKSITQ